MRSEVLLRGNTSGKFRKGMAWLGRIDRDQNVYVIAKKSKGFDDFTIPPPFDAARAVPVLMYDPAG